MPEKQPYIWRLISLGIEAERRGRGIDFAFHVAALLWGGTRSWDQGDQLAAATRKAGLDLEELEASITSRNVRAEIADNHKRLEAAGHWGVPTLVFDSEPFFGQDRIEMVKWRMEQNGLVKR